MNRSPRGADPTCVLLTVEQAAIRLGIGRSTAYQLIATGQLATIRIGRLRRIPVDALAAFVDSMRTPSPDGVETGGRRRQGDETMTL